MTLEAKGKPVASVGFSPDGQRIATKASWDIARVWDATSGECILELSEGVGREETVVTFSADNQRIITSGYEQGILAKVWDAVSGTLLQTNVGYSDGWYVMNSNGLVNYGGILRLLEVRGSNTRVPQSLM